MGYDMSLFLEDKPINIYAPKKPKGVKYGN